MKVSVTVNTTDVTDLDLKQMVQLGIDCVDFGMGHSFKGVKEQGYPDLDSLLQLKKRLWSWGLEINRVTLPDITEDFMKDLPGSEIQIENSVNAVKVFGEAGIKIVRQRFKGDVFPGRSQSYKSIQRGGAVGRGESIGLLKEKSDTPTMEELEVWWSQFQKAYRPIVLTGLENDVKVAMHPSDTPHPDSPFGGIGLNRILDDFPQKNVGFVYCIGTRAEAGGSSLVIDEINHFGRKGRIFLVHFRNVRGSLPTAGAFEEAMLDDGDLNMFKILLELDKVGYQGCLNPDHVLTFAGDTPDLNENWAYSNIGWKHSSLGFAYSVGYIKALLNALVEFKGRPY